MCSSDLGTVRARSSRACSSRATGLYNPKAFITHAALLRQAFAHCAIFPTAASRRSLDRVSVPVWLVVLSDQLPVVGLVSRYLTNYRDRPRAHPSVTLAGLFSQLRRAVVLSGISPSFDKLSQTKG